MSQTYLEVPATEKVRDSRAKLLDRDEALRSSFAGASAPSSPTPVDGQHWYDSSNHLPKQRVNGSWLALATQSYVDTALAGLLAAADAMVFKGVIDCSTNPNYPAADAGHLYRVSVAGKIGGASGVDVEVGDLIICTADSTASGNHATVGSSWTISQTNTDGVVVGPSSATSTAVAIFDGTTGKLVKQAAGVTISADNTLAIRPTSASVSMGIDILQSGPTTGTQGDGDGNLIFNQVLVNGDRASITNTGYALAVLYGLGGSNLQGQRCALVGRVVFNTASNASNPLKIYFGVSGEAQASVGDGGTNTSSGAAGRFGGLYASSIAAAGATNIFSVDGLEINTSLRSTSSARFHVGIKIAPWADNQVDPAELGAAIQITTQTGGLPYKHFAIVFDANSVGGGQPVGSAGTLIGALGAVSCAKGVDFSSATFSGNAITTPGFVVGSTGNVTIQKASATLTVDATSGNSFIVIEREAGNLGGISFRTASSERWRFAVTNDSESGANAASNLVLQAYDDSGTLLRNQFTFVRSTGTVTFGGEVVISSTQPALRLDETDAGTDQRYSYIYQASGVLHFAMSTDGFSITDWLTVSKTSGVGTLATFGVAVKSTASITAHSATAIPAGGTAGAGLLVSSTANFGVFFGSGAPTLSAAQGSLYMRSNAAGYIYANTNGSTGWGEHSPHEIKPLFKLVADMTSTSDQQFSKVGDWSGSYIILAIRTYSGASNGNASSAVGGIFTGAGGTGDAFVSSFSWTAMNGNNVGQALTLTSGANSARIPRTETPYLKLSTGHGSTSQLTILIEGYLVP